MGPFDRWLSTRFCQPSLLPHISPISHVRLEPGVACMPHHRSEYSINRELQGSLRKLALPGILDRLK
jgi:hypothetical protein